MNRGQSLKVEAEKQGIPLRTLADVKRDLEQAVKTGADMSMARLMVKHGRLTDEAMAFAEAWGAK